MIPKDLIEKCDSIQVCEKRESSDKYIELVFLTKDTAKVTEALSGSLGSPAKPQGTKPTKEDLQLTEEYGGIFPNQTLFKKENENLTLIAMFWPWGDGTHTTLKVASVVPKKKGIFPFLK